MFSLSKHLCNVCPEIKIIDVGAMVVGDNKNAYDKISDTSKVFGFEPDKEECSKLNHDSDNNRTYFPYFIGDGTTGTFRRCNENMTSSFFEPNTELLEKFQSLAEFTAVENRTEEKTVPLDSFEELTVADYLKVDAQGSEVNIFNGAKKLLSNGMLVVHTEVCFVPLYIDQPLFAEIDQKLRSLGFLFHKFPYKGICGRAFKPMSIANKPFSPISQLMWTDAVYVKDFTKLDQLSDDKLLKLAVILHDMYSSYDMANLALEAYDKKTGSELAKVYRNTLTKENKK